VRWLDRDETAPGILLVWVAVCIGLWGAVTLSAIFSKRDPSRPTSRAAGGLEMPLPEFGIQRRMHEQSLPRTPWAVLP